MVVREWEEITNEVGKRIRQTRDRMALTQAEFAPTVGVSLRTLQSWEGGASMPRYSNLRAVSATCGVSLEWLLTGHNPPT